MTWQAGGCCHRASRWSASHGVTGRTRTSPKSCTTRSRSMPAPSSARRSGSSSRRGSGSSPATSVTTWPSTRFGRRSSTSTASGGPASTPPRCFPDVIGQLKEHGLAESEKGSWRRVVVEKPLGSNLQTARELNATISEVFPPESVFRIDHYLGKETVQNILAMRFANTMFEPIWNSNYVDHVQITMAEDIGIGGRAGY